LTRQEITRNYIDAQYLRKLSSLFVNGGNVDYWGLELEEKVNITPEWEFNGSASYQENEDDQGVEDISFIPNFMVKAGVSYHSSKGYSLGLFNSYFTEATSVSGAPIRNL
jgi:outer membrane receptor protein involved in Fe transport